MELYSWVGCVMKRTVLCLCVCVFAASGGDDPHIKLWDKLSELFRNFKKPSPYQPSSRSVAEMCKHYP